VPLTREFKETVQARIKRDGKYRKEPLREGVESLLAGDLDSGKALLRDYINATIGFEELSRVTKRPVKSLMRMFGPAGNPQARNSFEVIGTFNVPRVSSSSSRQNGELNVEPRVVGWRAGGYIGSKREEGEAEESSDPRIVHRTSTGPLNRRVSEPSSVIVRVSHSLTFRSGLDVSRLPSVAGARPRGDGARGICHSTSWGLVGTDTVLPHA
jgi:hypothetical protein